MTVTDIAKVAHEVNPAYCASLDDHSQPPWDQAPEWARDSAVNGVRFHIENPGATPAASHEKWLVQKRAEGWRWGPVKNPAAKEHPCFLPYEQLPREQRAKDYLFTAVVDALRPWVIREIK